MSLNLDRAKLKLHSTKYDFYKILKITRNGYMLYHFSIVSFYILHTTYIYYIYYTHTSLRLIKYSPSYYYFYLLFKLKLLKYQSLSLCIDVHFAFVVSLVSNKLKLNLLFQRLKAKKQKLSCSPF